MKFRIDLKIFVFLILFYFTRQIEVYSYIMIFSIIHEIGHLFAGLICKMKPETLEILPFGVSIQFKLTTNDNNKKILKSNILELKKIFVAIAGPLTNLLIIIVCLICDFKILHNEIVIFSNIIIGLFNLLPIFPLDGGRILKGIFRLSKGAKKAEIYTNEISHFMVIFMTIVCSIMIYYFHNIGFLVGLIYLWYLDIKEYKAYRIRMKMYELVSK